MSRLEEIAARVAAATPGPWSICMDEIHVEVAPYFLQPTGADTAFIDAVRDDVPFLLAEVERLRAGLTEIIAVAQSYEFGVYPIRLLLAVDDARALLAAPPEASNE